MLWVVASPRSPRSDRTLLCLSCLSKHPPWACRDPAQAPENGTHDGVNGLSSERWAAAASSVFSVSCLGGLSLGTMILDTRQDFWLQGLFSWSSFFFLLPKPVLAARCLPPMVLSNPLQLHSATLSYPPTQPGVTWPQRLRCAPPPDHL